MGIFFGGGGDFFFSPGSFGSWLLWLLVAPGGSWWLRGFLAFWLLAFCFLWLLRLLAPSAPGFCGSFGSCVPGGSWWLLASCLAPPAPLASSAPMAPSAPVAFGFYGSYSSSSLVLFSFSLHMQSKIVIIASKQNYYCNEKIFRKEGRQAGRKEASRSKKILLGSKRPPLRLVTTPERWMIRPTYIANECVMIM